MLADSEPHDDCNHSQNWVMVEKAKHNKGGSEMGKYPHVKRNDQHLSTFLMQNAPTHQKRTPGYL